jgi:hypothetical protein
MNNGALNEIVDRLEHLERENRRIRSLFKGALMLLLGVLGPVLYFGCQSRVNTIAAREIVLTDPQGHVRAKLSVSKAEGSTEFFPSLQFFDPSGQPNTSLSEAGLNFTYKESHAAFSFTGIEFHGRDDTHFLLSDLILSYSRGQSVFVVEPHVGKGISVIASVNGSQFGVIAEEEDASMYVSSPKGGELDITADKDGTRIDRFRPSRHN